MNATRAPQKATFSEHIKELRKRLTWSAAVFVTGGLVGYVYYAKIINFLKAPLNQPLYFDSVAGNFNLIMQVCVLFGLFLALPVLTYNLVCFIEPALGNKRVQRRNITMITLLSFALAGCGALFAYTVVLPMSLHFFQGFKVSGVHSLISATGFLNYVIKCITAFIVIFQIPLIILFINYIRPLPPRTLFKYERYIIVGSLVIALLLPFTYDPVTQFVIALPIILLYNLSLLLVWLINRKSAPKARKAQPVPLSVKPKPRVTPTPPAVRRPSQTVKDMQMLSRQLIVPRPQARPTLVQVRSVPRRPVPHHPVISDMVAPRPRN